MTNQPVCQAPRRVFLSSANPRGLCLYAEAGGKYVSRWCPFRMSSCTTRSSCLVRSRRRLLICYTRQMERDWKRRPPCLFTPALSTRSLRHQHPLAHHYSTPWSVLRTPHLLRLPCHVALELFYLALLERPLNLEDVRRSPCFGAVALCSAAGARNDRGRERRGEQRFPHDDVRDLNNVPFVFFVIFPDFPLFVYFFVPLYARPRSQAAGCGTARGLNMSRPRDDDKDQELDALCRKMSHSYEALKVV